MKKVTGKITRRIKENLPVSTSATVGVALAMIIMKRSLFESVIICSMVFGLASLIKRKGKCK